MKQVLAVDGNSLGHRAWHAMKNERVGPAWLTGGVVRMLATAWQDGPFDAVLIAFDSETNLRKERHAPYKANRPDKDPDLIEQLAKSQHVLGACGFNVRAQDGYEADDLLGAAATECQDLGVECALLSSDRDLLQYVTDAVRLIRPQHAMAASAIYEPASVLAEYGVPPEQYLELAALRGDASDGLEGVSGIGAKKASELLQKYGSIEGIYKHLGRLTRNQRDSFRSARDRVALNLDLMAPLANAVADVASALDAGVDVDAIDVGLTRAGLPEAAGMFRRVVTSVPPPTAPPSDVDTTDYGAWQASRRPAATATDETGAELNVVVDVGEQATVEQPSLFG